MVVLTEVNNFVWLGVGLALTVSGLVIFNFSNRAFWQLAIGGPLFLIGISLALFKIHEIILVIGAYFVVGWGLAFQNRDFWLPRRSIENTVEYKISRWFETRIRGSTPEGADKALGVEPLQGSRVFLSGTTAFWLNSLVDVKQVRGGRDEAVKHASWREAVWEIRQGKSGEDTERVLRALAIDYIVVHTQTSAEFYHDFKDPGKFEKIDSLVKIYEEDGDIILKLLSFRIGDDN